MCVAAKYKADTVIHPYTLDYCSGDCTTKRAQVFIAQEFIAAVYSSLANSTHCENFTGCGIINISVECTEVTQRKRDTRSVKRNCTHNVQIAFDFFIKMRDEELLDASDFWVEVTDTFTKMVESIGQSIDSGQLDLAVTGLPMQVKPDSLQVVKYWCHLLCPPGSLPTDKSLTCRMSITIQLSDNLVFRFVCGLVLLSRLKGFSTGLGTVFL